MNKKLAPELRSRVRSVQSRSRAAAARFGRLDRAASEQVGIIVECTGNIDDLIAVGFEQHSLVQHPTKDTRLPQESSPSTVSKISPPSIMWWRSKALDACTRN